MGNDTKKWIKILFAIALAAPILTAIFASGNGPFAQFATLVAGQDPVTNADNALAGNNYLPIIGAAVALIPVGLLGVFFFKFLSGTVGNSKSRKKSRRM